MRKLYAEGVRVNLMDPADLADDALVAVVSNMGRRWSARCTWSLVGTNTTAGRL